MMSMKETYERRGVAEKKIKINEQNCNNLMVSVKSWGGVDFVANVGGQD